MKTLEALIRFALEHYPTLRNHRQFMSMWDQIRTEREALDKLVVVAQSIENDLRQHVTEPGSAVREMFAQQKLRNALAECRRAGVFG